MSKTNDGKLTPMEAAKMSRGVLALSAIIIMMQTNHDAYVALFDAILKFLGGPIGPILVKYIGGAAIFNIASFISGIYTAQDGGVIAAKTEGTFAGLLCKAAKYTGYTAAAASVAMPILAYAASVLAPLLQNVKHLLS